MIEEVLLIASFITLLSILAIVRHGFREVIKGLEAIDERLAGARVPR
jgi:hypothetical protein